MIISGRVGLTPFRSVRGRLAKLGVGSDGSSAVSDLAAVGTTLVGWRNGPLEDWHADPDCRIDDAQLMRASVATTRLVREAMISTGLVPFRSLVDVLGDLDRLLPDGRALAQVAPTRDNACLHVAYVESAVRRWDALAAEVGSEAVVGMLACAGACGARRWWGTPWWPARVRWFLHGLGSNDAQILESRHGLETGQLEQQLLAEPDRMDADVVAACLKAGLGDPAHGVEPLVDRRFRVPATLVEPDTPDPLYRSLLAEFVRWGDRHE